MDEILELIMAGEREGVVFEVHRGQLFSYTYRPLDIRMEVRLILSAEEVHRELLATRGADSEALLGLWCADEFLRCQFDRIADFDNFAHAQGNRILANGLQSGNK